MNLKMMSITPDTCKSYIKAGLDVIIEKNAVIMLALDVFIRTVELRF